MAFLRLNDIVAKVFDILRQDVRTIGLDWTKYKRSIGQIQTFPAGSVYVEGAVPTITPETMPGGDLGRLQVTIEMFFADHRGVEETEEAARDAIDALDDVLVNTARLGSAWDIGLDYAFPVVLASAIRIYPESAPPYVIVESLLSIEIRPV